MKGKLILILGSSGSGKGTVLAGLRERHADWVFPKSCTTRLPRSNKKGEEVYDFVSKDEFKAKIEAGDFLEWAVVHGENYYGTLKRPILDALGDGKIVVREVDVQGLASIREIIPKENLVSFFLEVESWDVLKERILGRSAMEDDELERRYESYLKESEWAKECDYVIPSITGQADKAVKQIDEFIGSSD